MEVNSDEVTLISIGNGAAVELFSEEMKKVLFNILDPNTEAEAVREITITVSIKPNKRRDKASADIKVKSKLPSNTPYSTNIFIGQENGEVKAIESNPVQPPLPFSDERGPKEVKIAN